MASRTTDLELRSCQLRSKFKKPRGKLALSRGSRGDTTGSTWQNRKYLDNIMWKNCAPHSHQQRPGGELDFCPFQALKGHFDKPPPGTVVSKAAEYRPGCSTPTSDKAVHSHLRPSSRCQWGPHRESTLPSLPGSNEAPLPSLLLWHRGGLGERGLSVTWGAEVASGRRRDTGLSVTWGAVTRHSDPSQTSW